LNNKSELKTKLETEVLTRIINKFWWKVYIKYATSIFNIYFK
jgi:hypothetical protein